MGKFKSIIVEPGTVLPDGKRVNVITAQIPLNEAAKASKLAEEAIALGVYTPKDGEEPAKMRDKIRKREAEAAAKGKRS